MLDGFFDPEDLEDWDGRQEVYRPGLSKSDQRRMEMERMGPESLEDYTGPSPMMKALQGEQSVALLFTKKSTFELFNDLFMVRGKPGNFHVVENALLRDILALVRARKQKEKGADNDGP